MNSEEKKELEELRKLKHQLLTDWNVVKEDFHCTPDKKLQLVRNGEVWWVGIGENVGVEINGKSEYFSRPVLVLKKLSRYGFRVCRSRRNRTRGHGTFRLNFKTVLRQRFCRKRGFSAWRGSMSASDKCRIQI